MSTHIEKVSQWIHDIRYEDIPLDVVLIAKAQFADFISAIIAGAQSTVGIKIIDSCRNTWHDGPCTFIPEDKSLDLYSTVYLHAVLANAIEFDNLVFMGHVSQSSVSVPLAMGEKLGSSTNDILLAQIVATEVAGRMGAYFALGPQQGHMRSYLHRVASTAACCKLLSCDVEITSRAMAIALSMPEFPLYPAAFSPDTKALCTGAPSVEGIKSTYLAMNDVDASLDILENPVGFYSFLTYVDKMPDVWGQIGKSWSLYALSSKMSPSCAYAQSSVQAVEEILSNQEINPKEINKIRVRAPITTVAMEAFSKPHNDQVTVVNTNFSTKRSIAATLISRKLTSHFFTPEVFNEARDEISSIADKVELLHDWNLSVALIKGIDKAIVGAGKPGVFGMGQTEKTFKKFKESFGSRKLFTISDFYNIAILPSLNRNYLLKRMWKSKRYKLPFLNPEKKNNYRSFEGDLSKFEFAQSSIISIKLKDGKLFDSRCDIPKGFAGDPSRLENIREKFIKEVKNMIGKDTAEIMYNDILELPKTNVSTILNYLR
ncbi:MAG: hypothetical protein HKN68_22115 [Saprospiraceae bacterium]|nr:hypothetical protein [Saprospiraceae bacterium]